MFSYATARVSAHSVPIVEPECRFTACHGLGGTAAERDNAVGRSLIDWALRCLLLDKPRILLGRIACKWNASRCLVTRSIGISIGFSSNSLADFGLNPNSRPYVDAGME